MPGLQPLSAQLRGDPCLPLLWLFLGPICCSYAPPGWRFTASEIVIPRKVSHRVSTAEIQGQLSYKIRFGGQRHVVHMRVKKSLLPRHFPVITDNDQGAMQEDYPFVPRDCYYYGYLEGVPGSMGTLDTCHGGLRGMLQVDDFTYEIKPLEASSKFEHVISLLVSQKTPGEDEKCKIGGEDTNQADEEALLAEMPRAGPVYMWWPHRKSLKMHYTVSYSLYLQQTNQTLIVENVMILNNIVHSIFLYNLVEVHVRLLCIWTRTEKFEVGARKWRSIDNAVAHFGYWEINLHNLHPRDCSILFTGDKAHHANYFAFKSGLCKPNWGSSYIFLARYHIFMGASLSAHVICHLFGCDHDTSGCHCFRRAKCVMAPEPGFLDVMSNCSYGSLASWVNGRWDGCLSARNIPYDNIPYVAPRCGDKIRNLREDCDCGTLKDCAKDKCCESHCVFTLGSSCYQGPCCIDCKHAQPGKVCRDVLGICDLPEYCTGTTHACPRDSYIQDGTPCSPLAVCVRGNCSDRDMQCQALFGFKIKDAAPACYKTLNVKGDRFGNCGVKPHQGGSRPVPCELDDIYCGLLHCTAISKIPSGNEHTTFRHMLVHDVKPQTCFGFDAHHSSQVPEMGLVVDGASCGPGKYCKDQNCTFYPDLRFDCDVQKCNFRGVCNNRKHCHCQQGWKPPNCSAVGAGGSVDSGPPPDKHMYSGTKIVTEIDKELVLLLLRFFLFFIMTLEFCIFYGPTTPQGDIDC
uniref:Disintegrin and metalloproteinase domain-containing protein 20-like n=1 Tax=Sus scrofa TaxID=9823 RepID=A0A8D2BU05_PIG